MNLTSDQTAIVFIGSFNPRLFHPSWLESAGVLTTSEAKAALEEKPRDNDPTILNAVAMIVTEEVAQVSLLGLQLTVQPSRLSVIAATQDRHTRSFEIASALVDLLPHSPVN